MDPLGRGPAQPEETKDDARPTEAGERKTPVFFNGGPGGVTGFGTLEDFVVDEKESTGEAGADADRKKGKASDARGHAVGALEYDWVGFEEEVCFIGSASWRLNGEDADTEIAYARAR